MQTGRLRSEGKARLGEDIVKSFDEGLERLTNTIARMGGLAELQIAGAIQAVTRRDSALASAIVQADQKIDEEREVDEPAIQMLVLRQPMASDLRTVVHPEGENAPS
jgi:phosphate transport system protein